MIVQMRNPEIQNNPGVGPSGGEERDGSGSGRGAAGAVAARVPILVGSVLVIIGGAAASYPPVTYKSDADPRKFLLDPPGSRFRYTRWVARCWRLTAPLAHSAEHSPRKGKVHGSNP